MTQIEIAQVLAMIKLQYGGSAIQDIDTATQESIFVRLCDRGYMVFTPYFSDEYVEDDEFIKHRIRNPDWGYRFTDKAHKLLRRKAHELSMRPLR